MKIEDRLASPDILKVLSIIAVVFIHGSNLIPNINSKESIISINLMFRFCVPVFIFLWAYFQERSIIKHSNITVLLKARFKTLFIPFIFWSLLYFLITADFRNLNILSAITKHWSGYGWSGQYYFIILFQLIIFFPIIRLINAKSNYTLFALYLLSIALYSLISYTSFFSIPILAKINDRLFIYWLPYVVLGVTYARRNIFPIKVPLILALCSIVIIPLEMYYLKPQTASNYLLPSVFLVSCFLISYLEKNIQYKSFNKAVQWLIQIIATNTLAIFCLNPLVIITLSPKIMKYSEYLTYPGSVFFNPIFSTAFIVIICILISLLLKKLRLNMIVAS